MEGELKTVNTAARGLFSDACHDGNFGLVLEGTTLTSVNRVDALFMALIGKE